MNSNYEITPVKVERATVVEVENAPKKRKKAKPFIPTNPHDLIATSRRVNETWKNKPEYSLVKYTPESFAAQIELYDEAVNSKTKSKAKRSTLSDRLKIVNEAIDDGLFYLKNYILDLFDKRSGRAYFPEFGIIKYNGGYVIPSEQSQRLAALDIMLGAIDKYELTDERRGKKHWSDLRNEFYELIHSTSTTDSTTTEKTLDKKTLKAEVSHTLRTIFEMIKTNHPDNFKEIARIWGFHREKG